MTNIKYTTSDGTQITIPYSGWGHEVTVTGQHQEDNFWVIDFNKDVTNIPENAFKGVNRITSLILPPTIVDISRYILSNGGPIHTIIFDGTYEQWMNVKKAKDWIKGSNVTVVNTHNGEVALFMDRISYTTTDNVSIEPHNTYGYKIKSRNFTNGQGTIIFDKTFWKVGDTPASFFYNRPTLKSIILPSYMGRVHNNVFAGCTNLEHVTLPKNIIYMENNIFDGCYKLTELYYLGTKCDWSVLVDNSKNWNYNSLISVVHCIDGDVTNVISRNECKGVGPVPPHPDPEPTGDCPCVEISGDDFVEYM